MRQDQLASSLATNEKRALEYFIGRFWLLMSTVSTPCTPPTALALEHRVVLLAACVIADTHRVLQDGRNSPRMLMTKRGQRLEAVRNELSGCCSHATQGKTLTTLLVAVLLLYFNDGFLEDPQKGESSTASHRDGLRAIIDRLGGVEAIVNDSFPESLQMLVSQFASADHTTTLLRGGKPSFSPETWQKLDKGHVWWTRDPIERCSLASVFEQMSRMAFYRDALTQGLERLSVNQVREFEVALNPVYASLTLEDVLENHHCNGTGQGAKQDNTTAVDAYSLIRSFQHTALIYLYRAICGLPVAHPLVQQHVLLRLDTVAVVEKPSKVLQCVILPLLVAGTHAQSSKHRRNTKKSVNLIHGDMKFASVQAVSQHLDAVWKENTVDSSWYEMFNKLGLNTVVL